MCVSSSPLFLTLAACYTWIRRHFHLCAMVHKKCVNSPTSNCRKLLSQYRAAGVWFTNDAPTSSWPPRHDNESDGGENQGRNTSVGDAESAREVALPAPAPAPPAPAVPVPVRVVRPTQLAPRRLTRSQRRAQRTSTDATTGLDALVMASAIQVGAVCVCV